MHSDMQGTNLAIQTVNEGCRMFLKLDCEEKMPQLPLNLTLMRLVSDQQIVAVYEQPPAGCKPQPMVISLCAHHCANVVHTSLNSCENLRSYQPDYHHYSDVDYWTRGSPQPKHQLNKIWNCRSICNAASHFIPPSHSCLLCVQWMSGVV